MDTTAKTSAVDAINEVLGKIANSSEIFKFEFSTLGFDAIFNNSPMSSTCIIRVSASLTTPFNSNNFVGLQWKNGNGNYGFQLITGWGSSGKLYYRDKNAGNWGNWVQV